MDPTKVWEFIPSPPNFAAVISSARRLDYGNTLVAFGTRSGIAAGTGPTEVYEVTAQGHPIWHMLVNNITAMFRAEPIESIAGERPVAPPLR